MNVRTRNNGHQSHTTKKTANYLRFLAKTIPNFRNLLTVTDIHEIRG